MVFKASSPAEHLIIWHAARARDDDAMDAQIPELKTSRRHERARERIAQPYLPGPLLIEMQTV
jgi:hypothetical protein